MSDTQQTVRARPRGRRRPVGDAGRRGGPPSHGNGAPAHTAGDDWRSRARAALRWPRRYTRSQALPRARLGWWPAAATSVPRGAGQLATGGLEHVEIIGPAPSTRRSGRCARPYPGTSWWGSPGESDCSGRLGAGRVPGGQHHEERLAFWQRQFAMHEVPWLPRRARCALRQVRWDGPRLCGRLPVSFPTFRDQALHTAGAGKCVECHACEEACLADIPLAPLCDSASTAGTFWLPDRHGAGRASAVFLKAGGVDAELDYDVGTVCIYCGAGCGLNVQVMDGEVMGVLPARSPRLPGQLCAKGCGRPFVAHADRLQTPSSGRTAPSAPRREEALDSSPAA